MSIFLRMPRRGYGFLFTFILMLQILGTPAVAQQVTEEWERRYGSALPTFESGALIATDAAGNTYVAGSSRNSSFTSSNHSDAVLVIKYSPTGEVLWHQRYLGVNPIAARDVAVDETGFYVAASTVGAGIRTVMYLVKFNAADGQVAWRQAEGPGTFTTGIQVLADNRGGVVVVGSVEIAAPGDVTFLAKYDASDGEKVWQENLSVIDRPAPYQHLAGIALDRQGDIYLAGSQGVVENESQTLTTKRSGADGSLVWQQRYETDLQTRAMQLAVDDAGGVYTWGIQYATDRNTPQGSFLVRYDAANGNQVWHRQMEGAGIPAQLIADADGGLYLRTHVQGGSQLARYRASDGGLIWSAHFQGTVAGMDVDEEGNLFVGGSSVAADYVVRLYNAARGEIAWEFVSPGDDQDRYVLDALVVSDGGALHLGGTFGSGNSSLFAASHSTADGRIVFSSIFKNTIPGIDKPAGIATDSAGNVFIAGTVGKDLATNQNEDVIVLKYSPAGELLWSRQYGDRFADAANSMAVDAAGDVYVMVTSTGSDSRPDVVVLKLSGATGDVLWEALHGAGQVSYGWEMKLDNLGGIYITGQANSMFGVRSLEFISKINAETGEGVWGKRYSPELVESDMFELASFAIDEAGDVYVTGTKGGSGVANNLILVKYAGTDGDPVWLEVYNSRNRQTAHYPTGVAVDTAGGVYVAAYNDLLSGERESYLMKYGASDGEQLWLQPTRDQGITPGRLDNLLVDNAGGAYVTGFINGVPHVIKFSTEEPGNLWAAPYEGVISAIALDRAGGIYATGLAEGAIRTVKFRTSDGAKAWEAVKEGNSEVALLALDNDRNVLVSGTVFNPDTSHDVLTVKYSQGEEPCHVPVQVQLYLPPSAIRAGTQVRTTADFGSHLLTEEDTGIRWAWGDGTTPSVSYTAIGTSRITGQHTYKQAGIYKVGLDFSESCLAPANEGYEQWQVIYDPEVGHVVGAGWIDSPQAAYPLMAAAGRVHFAFGVRYSGNNATTPQGHLLLQLSNHNLFRSSSMEWLVISGDRAVWRGTGSIRGQGRYGFVASVRDAGGRGVNDRNDQLRIRIWDMNRGNAIVYDNFEQAGDIYDMTTAGQQIERGNILINNRELNELLASLQNSAMTDLPQLRALEVYPNPAQSHTRISFVLEQEGAYTLNLYDMKGALVKELKQGHAAADTRTEVAVDVSELVKGVYLAQLSTDYGNKAIRLVIDK